MYFDEVQQWIEPRRFADIMEKHWISDLGNVSSKALYATWGWMAHFFRCHITDHGTPDA